MLSVIENNVVLPDNTLLCIKTLKIEELYNSIVALANPVLTNANKSWSHVSTMLNKDNNQN